MVAKVYLDLAKKIDSIYKKKFPIGQKLMDTISQEAERTGEVRTILGRRTLFDLWVPEHNAYGKKKPKPLPYSQAFKLYGVDLKRANCYKAVNYKLQGSAADLMKKGMVGAYNEGIFERTGYPHITVHDELDFSYHPDLKKDFDDLRECMENAIQLKVPVVMDMETGPDWGHVK